MARMMKIPKNINDLVVQASPYLPSISMEELQDKLQPARRIIDRRPEAKTKTGGVGS
jgi:hypothetical protein